MGRQGRKRGNKSIIVREREGMIWLVWKISVFPCSVLSCFSLFLSIGAMDMIWPIGEREGVMYVSEERGSALEYACVREKVCRYSLSVKKMKGKLFFY